MKAPAMALETALRLIELGLAFALIQRGAEHLRREPWLFGAQILAALILATGLWSVPALVGLWALGLAQLHRFHGPYNGGSDKMVLLALSCLMVARMGPALAELALSYLAIQLMLSYAVSGFVKVKRRDWLSGDALREVFLYSVYPTNRTLRRLGQNPGLMRAGSWAVIAVELAFPLTLLAPWALILMLCVTTLFHLANAVFFGLNRFFWAWIAVYPSVLWFQDRIFA